MKKTITVILAIALMAVSANAVMPKLSTYTMLARGIALTSMEFSDRPVVSYDLLLETAVYRMKDYLPTSVDPYAVMYDIDKKDKVIIHTMMIVDRSLGYLKANIGRGDVAVDLYDAIGDPVVMDEVVSVAKASIVEAIKDDPIYADLFNMGYTFRYRYIWIVDKRELFTFDIN